MCVFLSFVFVFLCAMGLVPEIKLMMMMIRDVARRGALEVEARASPPWISPHNFSV